MSFMSFIDYALEGPLIMQRHRTVKPIIRLCLALAFFLSSTLPGYAVELTQRDWMITLVDALGWSYGLPDEPQDPDYINILTGNRAFRFEAEDVYAKGEDNVSLMSFRNFGPFSGRGWLHGSRVPTAVHLKFNLPISGEYQLQAHLRQAGHQFVVDGKVKLADAKQEFTKVTVGNFQLRAGEQEFILTLPQNGSIDYISLTAPNLAAITPSGGWQPDEPLTWETIQTTLLQLLQLAELFPKAPTSLVIEAEDLPRTEAKVVDIPHLGQPSGGKWLRIGPLPTDIRFPIKLIQSGFYDLSLRIMGDQIRIIVGNHQEIVLEAKAYLDDYTFKALYFFAGNSNITVTLPPGGGVDKLSLTARQIDTTLVNSLLGLEPRTDIEQRDKPEGRDLDTLTSLLAAFGVKR
jgi:hypothetical protein